MDGTANNNFNSIDKEINEFISKNSKLIYKTESKKFGERHKEGGKEKKNTLDGKFTKVILYIINYYDLNNKAFS